MKSSTARRASTLTGAGKDTIGEMFFGKGIEKLLTALPHKFLREPQSPMRAHHAEARDMSMLDTIRGLLFHLGKHIAHDLRWVVRRFLRSRTLQYQKKSITIMPLLC